MKTQNGKNYSVERISWKGKKSVQKGDACSFRHDDSKRGQAAQSSSLAPRQNDRNSSSKGKSLRGRCLSGKEFRKPCRHGLQGNCTNPSNDYGHFPVCRNCTSESGCKIVEKCIFKHKEVDSQPYQKPKKSGGKGSVAFSKNSKQMGCVFQDTEPPKSMLILRKGTTFLGPKRSVQVSEVTLRHVKIRERKCPSPGVSPHSEPHERSPYAPMFEDRSQEETLQQERCARRDAWRND